MPFLNHPSHEQITEEGNDENEQIGGEPPDDTHEEDGSHIIWIRIYREGGEYQEQECNNQEDTKGVIHLLSEIISHN